MEWHDEALLLSVKRHGERDCIAEVISAAHGRHLGLVRGGRAPKQAAGLQPGNRVRASWRARLEEHLGNFTLEVTQSRAGLVLSDPLALKVVMHLALLLRLLPERSPNPKLFAAADGLCALLGHMPMLAPMLVRFELHVLADLGFGLDLQECAATGTREDLAFVSPKSGRAVCAQAGAPYAARLFRLPAFLRDPALRDVAHDDLAEGLRLTGFFLEQHIFLPRALKTGESRAAMVTTLLAHLEATQGTG